MLVDDLPLAALPPRAGLVYVNMFERLEGDLHFVVSGRRSLEAFARLPYSAIRHSISFFQHVWIKVTPALATSIAPLESGAVASCSRLARK